MWRSENLNSNPCINYAMSFLCIGKNGRENVNLIAFGLCNLINELL